MANNSVTLTASMRNNLLSLQNTQKLFDSTQERLSTGKKVNSALDNPTSYFTSQSLTKRADALSGLLDSMGQAVQTIKAADQSLSSVQTLVDQAKSLVNSALDTNNSGSYKIGSVSVQPSTNLGQIGGITANSKFTIRTGDASELKSSVSVTGTQTVASTGATGAAEFRLQDKDGSYQTVKIADVTAAADINELMTQIRDGFGIDSQGNFRVNVALVDGNMTITSSDPNKALIALGEGAASLGFDTGTEIDLTPGATATAATYMQAFDLGTGAGELAKADAAGTFTVNIGDTEFSVNVAAGDSIDSVVTAMQERLGDNARIEVAAAGVGLTNKSIMVTGTDPTLAVTIGGTATFESADSSASSAAVSSAAVTGSALPTTANTFDLMERLNGVNGISASINDAGKLVIQTKDGSDLIITSTSATAADGDAAAALGIAGVSTNGSDVRSTYASQFNDVLTQINQLVNNDDTSYKGVNLLNGQDLTVNFNETRTSQLEISGRVMNTKSLSLTSARGDWVSNDDVNLALEQIDVATKMIEEFSSELGQNLSIVQTRQDFTENMVNILQTGSDNLVLADMNEEAANMLALQVRQQLATNALSLSSQSAQSVLSLF